MNCSAGRGEFRCALCVATLRAPMCLSLRCLPTPRASAHPGLSKRLRIELARASRGSCALVQTRLHGGSTCPCTDWRISKDFLCHRLRHQLGLRASAEGRSDDKQSGSISSSSNFTSCCRGRFNARACSANRILDWNDSSAGLSALSNADNSQWIEGDG